MSIEDHIAQATSFRDNAQTVRAKARQLVEARNEAEARSKFEEAIEEHDKCIKRLEGLARRSRDQDYLRVIQELSKSLGSKGGTYRDARNVYKDGPNAALDKAIECYDRGYSLEEERRELGDPDSYNTVQRLVVRLLRYPKGLRERTDDNLDLTLEFQEASKLVEVQVEKGRSDSWVRADQALTALLSGADEGKILELFKDEDKNPITEYFETTHRVVIALRDEPELVDNNEGLKDRLESFARYLEDEGGLEPR